MKKMWVTLCWPVEVDETQAHVPLAQEALDLGWDLLLNPDEPPPGLLEFVTPHQPHIPVNLLAEEAIEAPSEEGSTKAA